MRAVPGGLALTGSDQPFHAQLKSFCLELTCLYTDLQNALRLFYYFTLLKCQLTRTVCGKEMKKEVRKNPFHHEEQLGTNKKMLSSPNCPGFAFPVSLGMGSTPQVLPAWFDHHFR